ncbi:MAG: hypothetical protein EOO40_12790, partial [Deltaproteobacteria bacterium]
PHAPSPVRGASSSSSSRSSSSPSGPPLGPLGLTAEALEAPDSPPATAALKQDVRALSQALAVPTLTKSDRRLGSAAGIVSRGIRFDAGPQLNVAKHIAAGSFGKLRPAADSEGNAYALKVLRQRPPTRKDQTERTLREEAAIEVALMRRYMGGLRIHAEADINDKIYICMPLMLDAHQAVARLSGEQRRNFVRALAFHIAGSLQSMHQDGWLHDDVKPQNILVSEQGRIYLADYGGVRPVNLSASEYLANTFQYAAPESLDFACEQVGPAADTWRLAMTLLSLHRNIVGAEPRLIQASRQYFGVDDFENIAAVRQAYLQDGNLLHCGDSEAAQFLRLID